MWLGWYGHRHKTCTDGNVCTCTGTYMYQKHSVCHRRGLIHSVTWHEMTWPPNDSYVHIYSYETDTNNALWTMTYTSPTLVVVSEGCATKLLLVHLWHESPPTVATVLDLWGVQVDEHPGVAQGLPPIAKCVVPLDHGHWFFSKEVDGKLLIHLSRPQTLQLMDQV